MERCERCEVELVEKHGLFGTLCKECDDLAFENETREELK